jgi:hypothetical protein
MLTFHRSYYAQGGEDPHVVLGWRMYYFTIRSKEAAGMTPGVRTVTLIGMPFGVQVESGCFLGWTRCGVFG